MYEFKFFNIFFKIIDRNPIENSCKLIAQNSWHWSGCFFYKSTRQITIISKQGELKKWKSSENHSDNLLLKVTYCSLCTRYDLNHSKATPRTSYTLNLCNIISWSTQLKPLENLEILKRLRIFYLGYRI